MAKAPVKPDAPKSDAAKPAAPKPKVVHHAQHTTKAQHASFKRADKAISKPMRIKH